MADLNQGRQLLAAVGTTTAALAFAGSPAPTPNQTEEWNGTSWTSKGAMAVNVYGSGGFGTSTLMLACGGLPPGTDTDANMRSAQHWNGTSWSEVAEMAISRSDGNGTGTAVGGLIFGGYAPNQSPAETNANKTEEWTVDAAVSTVTTS